jgi:hypothetical protein
MKKKKSTTLNWLTSLVLGAGLLITSTLIFSCNNGENGKKADSKTDTAEKIAMVKAGALYGTFPYLTLNKTDLQAFFAPSTNPPRSAIQKIVFRFQFDNETSLPSLVAYKATSVRMYDQTPLMPRLTKLGYNESFPDEIFLGNLEMSRQQYLNLIASAGTSTTLLFSPKLDNINVTYQVGWIGAGFTKDSLSSIKFLGGNDLNPSPPAVPGGPN